MEQEYKNIPYSSLQTIRINMAFRYQFEGKLTDGGYKKLHVLDEVMENIKRWCKKLPLSSNEDSWRNHSPNLVCTHQLLNFENDEYLHIV